MLPQRPGHQITRCAILSKLPSQASLPWLVLVPPINSKHKKSLEFYCYSCEEAICTDCMYENCTYYSGNVKHKAGYIKDAYKTKLKTIEGTVTT